MKIALEGHQFANMRGEKSWARGAGAPQTATKIGLLGEIPGEGVAAGAMIGTCAYLCLDHAFMTKEKSNREKFIDLLARSSLTQVEAAYRISKQTQRPCSPRTVRAWLAESTVPSSRTCPDWAVAALEKAIKALQQR